MVTDLITLTKAMLLASAGCFIFLSVLTLIGAVLIFLNGGNV